MTDSMWQMLWTMQTHFYDPRGWTLSNISFLLAQRWESICPRGMCRAGDEDKWRGGFWPGAASWWHELLGVPVLRSVSMCRGHWGSRVNTYLDNIKANRSVYCHHNPFSSSRLLKWNARYLLEDYSYKTSMMDDADVVSHHPLKGDVCHFCITCRARIAKRMFTFLRKLQVVKALSCIAFLLQCHTGCWGILVVKSALLGNFLTCC